MLRAPLLTKQEIDFLYGATLFDPSELDAAIVGVVNSKTGHVPVYDYDRIVSAYANMFRRDAGPANDDGDHDGDEDFYQQAVEWVDYNTLGVLPSLTRRPIVVRVASEMTSGKRFVFRGIKYRQLA